MTLVSAPVKKHVTPSRQASAKTLISVTLTGFFNSPFYRAMANQRKYQFSVFLSRLVTALNPVVDIFVTVRKEQYSKALELSFQQAKTFGAFSKFFPKLTSSICIPTSAGGKHSRPTSSSPFKQQLR